MKNLISAQLIHPSSQVIVKTKKAIKRFLNLAIKLFFKLWLNIVWYNLLLEASPKTPILGKNPMERLNDLSTITQLASGRHCVRTQASWLEQQDLCHYAIRPYFSQHVPFISEITTSLKCLTFFRGFRVINLEKGYQLDTKV